MDNKKTIVFITSRFPFPLEKGDKLRAYHQIKELSLSYHIILCSLTRTKIKKEWLNELDPYCQSIHTYKLNNFFIFTNLFKAFFEGKPFQIGFFFQRKIQKQIQLVVKTQQPDFIYCQLIRTTEYVKNIHSIPKVLDYMDALSTGMEKRAEISNWFKKIIFKIEGVRLKNYENNIFDYFDSHTIISHQDQKLIAHPSNQKITIVPNGIGAYFTNFDDTNIKKEYDIVFVGNLNYPPNIECCLFIINDILPLFIQNGINLKVLLSGANPSSKILKYSNNKNITITGWVDDIRLSYVKGKIFVAPLFIGTGLQNKLLEAMSLNVPCVTTSLANNALGAELNSEIIIANNAFEFYTAINLLLDNSELNSKMTIKANDFVNKHYNWQNATHKIPFN